MMQPVSSRRARFTWRSFGRDDGLRIQRRIRSGHSPCCPLCGVMLEARASTRVRDHLVLDATGYDLDCRTCRRFWCVIRHTPRSVRLIRMRRLVAAVRATGRASTRAGVQTLDEPELSAVA